MEMETMRVSVNDSFRNVVEFRDWANRKMNALNVSNQRVRDRYIGRPAIMRMMESNGIEWFGEGTTPEELIDGITEYSNPKLIDELMGKVNSDIPKATTEQVKARKLAFNDRGMGLFSFERAAMGLYRLKELHSESLGRRVEHEECRISGRNYVLAADGSEVTERWEQNADGKPKARTSTKKVFAWFSKRNKEREAVEIYIGCGGNSNLSAERMLYSGMGAIVFAQILAKAGIPTKITVMVGTTPDQAATAYFSLVPVKNYDEPLDANLLATLSSDPRFFRYDGFKGLIAVYDHFGQNIPNNLGSVMPREMLVRCIENSTYTKTAQLAPNRFYFGGTYSADAAISQVMDAIATLAKKLNQ
jgi:hypothetical protein